MGTALSGCGPLGRQRSFPKNTLRVPAGGARGTRPGLPSPARGSPLDPIVPNVHVEYLFIVKRWGGGTF